MSILTFFSQPLARNNAIVEGQIYKILENRTFWSRFAEYSNPSMCVRSSKRVPIPSPPPPPTHYRLHSTHQSPLRCAAASTPLLRSRKLCVPARPPALLYNAARPARKAESLRTRLASPHLLFEIRAEAPPRPLRQSDSGERYPPAASALLRSSLFSFSFLCFVFPGVDPASWFLRSADLLATCRAGGLVAFFFGIRH